MTIKITTHANPQGHSEGTWEYRLVAEDGSMWFDGGYASEESARTAAKKHLGRLRKDGIVE